MWCLLISTKFLILRFESDVILYSDKTLDWFINLGRLFESDVILYSDKTISPIHWISILFESDVILYSDKTNTGSNNRRGIV